MVWFFCLEEEPSEEAPVKEDKEMPLKGEMLFYGIRTTLGLDELLESYIS